jgi:hypothetical protein
MRTVFVFVVFRTQMKALPSTDTPTPLSRANAGWSYQITTDPVVARIWDNEEWPDRYLHYTFQVPDPIPNKLVEEASYYAACQYCSLNSEHDRKDAEVQEFERVFQELASTLRPALEPNLELDLD